MKEINWLAFSKRAHALKLTYDQFATLPDKPGVVQELTNGVLSMTPSPTGLHQILARKILIRLDAYLDKQARAVSSIPPTAGETVAEMDFRLGPETVRRPDVAFIGEDRLQAIDLDTSPLEVAPTVAIEIVSEANSALDLRKKIQEYLKAGSLSVWTVYPQLKLIEVHRADQPAASFSEPTNEQLIDPALPGFQLFLPDLFNRGRR